MRLITRLAAWLRSLFAKKPPADPTAQGGGGHGEE